MEFSDCDEYGYIPLVLPFSEVFVLDVVVADVVVDSDRKRTEEEDVSENTFSGTVDVGKDENFSAMEYDAES